MRGHHDDLCMQTFQTVTEIAWYCRAACCSPYGSKITCQAHVAIHLLCRVPNLCTSHVCALYHCRLWDAMPLIYDSMASNQQLKDVGCRAFLKLHTSLPS